MADDLRIALDPVALFRSVIGEPDPWQVRALRSTSKQLLFNCCRQSGKSTVTGVLAAHAAVFHAARVLIVSRAQDQSQETFDKALNAYRHIAHLAPADSASVLRLRLANGGRIYALPGSEETIRGYSGIHLLIVDEASRVEDDLYRTVRPMLAVSGGRLIAPSTPRGKRGWWSNAWHEGGSSWERYTITAEECPRISPEFLVEEAREMGPWWFKQEYQGMFLDTVDSVFSSADIGAAFTGDVQPFDFIRPLAGRM